MLYEAEAIQRTVNSYENQDRVEKAEELEEKYENKLDELSYLRRARKEMAEYRNDINYVIFSNYYTIQEKRREINELLSEQMEIARETVTDATPAFE